MSLLERDVVRAVNRIELSSLIQNRFCVVLLQRSFGRLMARVLMSGERRKEWMLMMVLFADVEVCMLRGCVS
jgi:hypothetical protein